MRSSLLKRLAVGYLLKTLLISIAWLAVPDLPQKALHAAREAWVQLAGD